MESQTLTHPKRKNTKTLNKQIYMAKNKHKMPSATIAMSSGNCVKHFKPEFQFLKELEQHLCCKEEQGQIDMKY